VGWPLQYKSKYYWSYTNTNKHSLYPSTLLSTAVSFQLLMKLKYNSQISLFQITNLMHNSFIYQQYVCYTTLLNMFRAARCSSSGGPIVSPRPLVSSPSVSSGTVCRWRAEYSPLSTCILYRCLWRVTIPEAEVIQLVLLRMSSVLLETCWGV